MLPFLGSSRTSRKMFSQLQACRYGNRRHMVLTSHEPQREKGSNQRKPLSPKSTWCAIAYECHRAHLSTRQVLTPQPCSNYGVCKTARLWMLSVLLHGTQAVLRLRYPEWKICSKSHKTLRWYWKLPVRGRWKLLGHVSLNINCSISCFVVIKLLYRYDFPLMNRNLNKIRFTLSLKEKQNCFHCHYRLDKYHDSAFITGPFNFLHFVKGTQVDYKIVFWI